MEIEEGDVVLCTVDRIVGTTVFVSIDWQGKELEGGIIFSEIAPGRIRNIRNYVVPKKKIVCKILRLSNGRIELSLRRVTQKEKKEVLEKHKQEKSYTKMLESVLGKKAESIIEKISEKETLYDFLQESKENSKVLEKIVGKDAAKKILEILESQKPKKISIKKEIELISSSPNGLEIIKDILKTLTLKSKEVEVRYISGGKYSIRIESEDPKKTDQELKEMLKIVEKKAKKNEVLFSILKK